MRRVAVTGLGVVSAVGCNRTDFWRAVRDGDCGIRPLTGLRGPLRFANGAQILDFDAGEQLERRESERLDRYAQFLLVAAREAVAAAGLEIDGGLGPRAAVVTGSSVGGQPTQEQAYLDIYGEGRPRLPPLTVPRVMVHAAASQVCLDLGVTGPSFTLSTACSSSNHALGHAFWMVRQGLVDLAITGGSEAPFNWVNLKAWEGLRAVSADTCRPFSKDRSGMILGEGGACLVLEDLETARRRGAPVLAEMVGFGMSSDAYHLTQPSVEGAARAIAMALADGGVEPSEVGYVNAHGTGTAANDASEVAALRRIFGDHADRLLVSSTKSVHGHTLGAAGALEAVASVMALGEGVAPPTVNYSEPDPECDLDVVPNAPRRADLGCVVSNSFAFGGLNAVVVFRRWDEL